MGLMAACGAMVLLGLATVFLWGGLDVQPPGHGVQATQAVDATPSTALRARRFVWYLAVAVVSGLGAGVLVAGAGGRLAMRLLAVTAGDDAQGRITEADQVVGRISADGTIGFIVFTALFFGLTTGALFLLVRRWLPAGRLGGLAYGALLLVLFSTRVEPLRRGNPDFDIVGPGWLSLVVFAAVVVIHGMVVAAVAARYSRALPLISPVPRALALHAPLLLLMLSPAVLFAVAVVGVVAVGLGQIRPLVQGIGSCRATLAGRVLLAALALVALPGFVSTVTDIAGRPR